MDCFGATQEEWDQFSLILGLTSDLLPVVSNPSAVISENSSIKTLGKLPSKYNNQHKVAGLTGWTDHISTPNDIDLWSKEPDYGICCIGRTLKFIDIDIGNRDISAKIAVFIATRLGILPMRTRSNSGKLLLAFSLPDPLPKRVIKTADGAIELLSHKQQALVAGTHPSGVRYTWAGGLPDNFPDISLEQFDKCWTELAATFGLSSSEESSNRNPFTATNFSPDPIADFLSNNWENYGAGKEGEIRIACPFKDEHTVDNGPSETVYFRQGTRDYKSGHFSCMHAHCSERTDHEFLTATGYLAADFEEVKDPEPKRDRLQPIRADIFAARPPVEWLIKGILPRGKLGMTYGSSGDGKTFAVLDMVLAICRGIPWNGHKTKRGHCVYICAEGAGGFTSRLKAYAEEHNVPLAEIGDYLTIIPETPNFRLAADVELIASHLATLPYKIDFIVVDTLAQVTAGADENSAKDMSLAIRNSEMLHDRTGAAIHLVHHAGKDEAKGARGWSGLKGPLDVQFCVSRDGENRQFWVAKLKDGRDGFGYAFNLQTKVLNTTDADGDPIDSCFVEYTGKSSAKRDREQKMGKWQQASADAWEALGNADAVFEEVLREAVNRIPKPDGKDVRREKCRNAIVTVINRAGYVINNGKIVSNL